MNENLSDLPQELINQLSKKARCAEAVSPEDEHAGKRFCGRCQTWRSEAIGELHHCVKAPRKIGYEWRERVVSGGGKLTPDEKLPKWGKLIERFEATE